MDLLAHLVDKRFKVDLLSDQTSCHVVYDGGYCPQGISFEERTRLLPKTGRPSVNWSTAACAVIMH